MGDRGFHVQDFCLPSEFLTDEHILMGNENMFREKINLTLPRTPLSTELPTQTLSYYNISNNFIIPPFPIGPTVPEIPWAMVNQSQPILSQVVGSGPAFVPSPPIAPIGRNINYYQVTNLNSQGQIHNFTPINPSSPLPYTMNDIMWGHQQVGGYFGNGGYDVMPGMGWGGPQVQNQQRSNGGVEMRVVGYGGGIKRERVGTGVFLPRGYQPTAPESRKNTGGSTAQPQPKPKVRAQNKKFEKKTHQLQSQRHSAVGGQISGNGSELVMARRNAALAQEKRKYELIMKTTNAATSASGEGMRVNNEIKLPQEWTY